MYCLNAESLNFAQILYWMHKKIGSKVRRNLLERQIFAKLFVNLFENRFSLLNDKCISFSALGKGGRNPSALSGQLSAAQRLQPARHWWDGGDGDVVLSPILSARICHLHRQDGLLLFTTGTSTRSYPKVQVNIQKGQDFWEKDALSPSSYRYGTFLLKAVCRICRPWYKLTGGRHLITCKLVKKVLQS